MGDTTYRDGVRPADRLLKSRARGLSAIGAREAKRAIAGDPLGRNHGGVRNATTAAGPWASLMRRGIAMVVRGRLRQARTCEPALIRRLLLSS